MNEEDLSCRGIKIDILDKKLDIHNPSNYTFKSRDVCGFTGCCNIPEWFINSEFGICMTCMEMLENEESRRERNDEQ